MIDTISMNAILYATCDMTDSLSFETLSLNLEHTGRLTDLKFNSHSEAVIVRGR